MHNKKAFNGDINNQHAINLFFYKVHFKKTLGRIQIFGGIYTFSNAIVIEVITVPRRRGMNTIFYEEAFETII